MPTLTMRRCTGFTLVELLVLITIVALLMALLLPMMSRARESSNAVRCAANLRSVGESLRSYATMSGDTLPIAYAQDAEGRYLHFSGHLLRLKFSRSEDFTCPSLDYGGLPPTNPAPNNFDPGQMSETSGVIDLQAARVAFALNESLVGARLSRLQHKSRTIVATELTQNWRLMSDAPSTGPAVCRSHRPVHPGAHPDWIGRNHNDRAHTTFLYADGHVETKSLIETIAAAEWGETNLAEAQ